MCKSSRILSLILALVFVVACFAGCGGTSSSAAGSTSAASSAGGEAEPVTLRFSWWGGEARHEATIAAAELYMEKKPNVKIEFEYSGWDGYKDKLVTQLSGGTAPDIMQVNYDWIYDLRKQDQYFSDPRDFEGILDLSGFSETAYNGCWVDEELQGLPSGLSVTTLIVDKPFFEEHGLDSSDPTYWTWDKVLAEGKRIHEENPEHYLLNEFPTGRSFVVTLLAQKGIELVDKDYNVACTEEQLVEALNMLKTFIDSGVMLPFEQSSIYAQQTEQFPKWLNNEMGMFMQVASTIPSFSDMELDVMLIPQYEDAVNSGASLYPTNLICINAKSDKQEEAAKFLNFFFNDPEAIAILGDVRGVPPTEAARTQLEEAGTLNPLIGKAIALGEEHPGMAFHEASFNSELTKVENEYIERFGYGEATAEETASELLAELESICEPLRTA